MKVVRTMEPSDGEREAADRVSRDEAAASLSRVLASETFARAPVLRRLLDYLVARTLSGRTDELKEYVLGVDVFDRGDSFDPRTDTIVRVQARRLRARLADYYAGPGIADPIVIGLPKGSYAVTFRPVVPASVPSTDDRSLLLPGTGTAAVLPKPLPLPAARTALVGRDQDLSAVKRLLDRGDVRLLTLSGPGGSGKTRLALRAAAEAEPLFPGGIYLIALGSVTDAAATAREIAHAVGLRQTDVTPLLLALQRHLRDAVREPTLLVLDNFEQLIGAAPVLTALLDACGPLKILVTSRTVLHVTGEHNYKVTPLPIPAAPGTSPLTVLEANPAVTLFVERARAIEPSFTLNVDNAGAVAEICVRLDGLPLALELAAARIKVLTPAQLCGRLTSRLDLLTGGAADLPERQQTLRCTLDWSHALLTPAEQRVFRRLAIFAGGCTLEAVEAVCNTWRDADGGVLDVMSSLVDKNLIQPIGGSDQRRFGMLETVREFAGEQLAASGETERVRRAHAAYSLVLAEEVASRKTPAQFAEWLALCDGERDNLRAALTYLTETKQSEWALRMSVSLYRFWEHREYLVEARAWLESVLALAPGAGSAHRARALSYAATLASRQGDYSVASSRHHEALATYRELGDRKGTISQMNSMSACERFRGNYESARQWSALTLDACREEGDPVATAAALSNLADTALRLGEHAEARALLREAAEIFQDLDDRNSLAWCDNHLGDVALDIGDLAEARRHYEEGARRFQEIGNAWGVARSACDLGQLACEEQNFTAARRSFRQALTAFSELGHKRGIATALDGLARLAAGEADTARALTIAGAAAALRHGTGALARSEQDRRLDGVLDRAAAECDPTLARTLWTRGWEMGLDDAIRFGLEEGVGKEAATGSWTDRGGAAPPRRDPPGAPPAGRVVE
jgi:predicted ATPase